MTVNSLGNAAHIDGHTTRPIFCFLPDMYRGNVSRSLGHAPQLLASYFTANTLSRVAERNQCLLAKPQA